MQNICNIKMHQKSNIYQWKMAFGEPFTERHNMASYFYKNAIRKKKSVGSREYLNLYAPVSYSFTLWHRGNYRLQLTKFKVRLETSFRKVTWNMTIFSSIQSTTKTSSRNLWTSAHTIKTFSLGPFFFVIWVNFHQSSLDQLQCTSADYQVSGPLYHLGSCCSSNYSVSTHALQIGALWPLQLFFYLATSFFYPLSTQPKPCEENAPFPNFLPVENRVKDDRRSFFSSLSKRPQSAMLDPLPLQKNIKVYKWNFCIWSSFQIW